MSRLSSTVVFGCLVIGIVTLNAACTVKAEVKTKNRFVEDGVAANDTSTGDWNGEPITIQAEGVGASVNGGLDVTVSANAKKPSATARMLAMADAEDKTSADQSIVDAKATFKITNDGGTWKIVCGHGGSHGSSDSGSSGCEKLSVVIPAGDATHPITADPVASGNGSVNIDMHDATLKQLGVNGKGDITVRAPSTKGASVSVVAPNADDISILLPTSFSADDIELNADKDKITTTVSGLTLTDTASGKKGSHGTQGEGLASVKATSQEFAGSTGAVSLGTF